MPLGLSVLPERRQDLAADGFRPCKVGVVRRKANAGKDRFRHFGRGQRIGLVPRTMERASQVYPSVYQILVLWTEQAREVSNLLVREGHGFVRTALHDEIHGQIPQRERLFEVFAGTEPI